MGYFSNGSEGMDYEARYCDRCVHQEGGCMVWFAHIDRNYEECNNEKSILHLLIPRGDNGMGNGKCNMFYPIPSERMTEADRKYMEWKRANSKPVQDNDT